MTEEEHDERDDLPILLTVGGPSQQTLWEPIGDKFRILFGDHKACLLAQNDGVYSSSVDQATDNQMVEYTKSKSFWLADAALDHLAEKNGFIEDHPHLRPPLLDDWAPGFLFNRAAEVVLRTLAIERMQEEEGEIVGIFLHEDVTSHGRFYAEWGHSMGLPVLHIPHANHFVAPGTGDVHCQISSDKIAVYGPYMRDWYLGCGATEDMLTIVGAPQFDKFYDKERLPSKDTARLALDIEPDEFVIAYATTWGQGTSLFEYDLNWSTHRVLQAAERMNARLIFKVHPGAESEAEDEFVHDLLAYNLRGNVTRHHNEHILLAADVLICQGPSNLGISANIVGTPIAELMVSSARFPEKYGIPATWGDGLEDCIEETIKLGKNEDFIAEMDAGEGQATEKAVEWILEQLNR